MKSSDLRSLTCDPVAFFNAAVVAQARDDCMVFGTGAYIEHDGGSFEHIPPDHLWECGPNGATYLRKPFAFWRTPNIKWFTLRAETHYGHSPAMAALDDIYDLKKAWTIIHNKETQHMTFHADQQMHAYATYISNTSTKPPAEMPRAFDPNWGHGFVTRTGAKARYMGPVYYRSGPWSGLTKKHVFAIVNATHGEVCQKVYGNGRVVGPTDSACPQDHNNDIFNAPAPLVDKSRWVNVYTSKSSHDVTTTDHPTQESADAGAKNTAYFWNRVACFQLTVKVPAE